MFLFGHKLSIYRFIGKFYLANLRYSLYFDTKQFLGGKKKKIYRSVPTSKPNSTLAQAQAQARSVTHGMKCFHKFFIFIFIFFCVCSSNNFIKTLISHVQEIISILSQNVKKRHRWWGWKSKILPKSFCLVSDLMCTFISLPPIVLNIKKWNVWKLLYDLLNRSIPNIFRCKKK